MSKIYFIPVYISIGLLLTSVITVSAKNLPTADILLTNKTTVIQRAKVASYVLKKHPGPDIDQQLSQRKEELVIEKRIEDDITKRVNQIKAEQELKQKEEARKANQLKAPTVDATGAIARGQELAAERGWTGNEWDALYNLWMKESRWNPNSINSSSGACGIPQALPCSKIPDFSSVDSQITWGLNYIANRPQYGSPSKAWQHWLDYNWY
jgi:hypothetical protein